MGQKVNCFIITVFIIAIYSIPLYAADPMLKWDASTGDVSGYTIYYGLSQGSYPFSKDVGNVTQYSLSNFSLSAGTTYYFVLRAYNASGESGDSNVTTYTVPSAGDTTPPIPPEGVSGDIVNEDFLLTWQANTETDIFGYRIYYGTSNRNYGLPIPVDGTEHSITGLNSDVTYYFAVTAVDSSGNESGYSFPEIIKTILIADTIAPSISIGFPTSVSSYNTTTSSVDISGTASDNKGVTEVVWSNSAGGSSTASGTNSWSVAGVDLVEGNNVITITAHDAAGNEALDIITIVYTIVDTTAPVVAITSPTTGTAYGIESDTLNIGGTASDGRGVTQVSWSNSRGGSGTATGTTSWSASDISLTEGENLIRVTARDEAGNTSTDTLTVAYTIPDTSIDSWTELTNDNFESGWGSFKDGGRDCRRNVASRYAHQGKYSIRIRSNGGKKSSFNYTNSVDVYTPDYSQIKIEFWYFPLGMKAKTNDRFFVEYYDGKKWRKVGRYRAKKEFSNGSFYHEEGIIINSGPDRVFPENMKIRFRCAARSGHRAKIYIDEVIVSVR